METIHNFGPNVVKFQLEMGDRRWYIVGCYLSPKDTSTIDSIAAALRDRPWVPELLVEGEFNADLAQPEGVQREEDIVAALTAEGLEDMLVHFLPQQIPWCLDRRVWSMVRLGREVSSRVDYILGTDCCLFRNVSARDLRHNSDHYLVIGCLRSTPLR